MGKLMVVLYIMLVAVAILLLLMTAQLERMIPVIAEAVSRAA